MRRRITATMVAVVAGALLVATVGTFLLLRVAVRNDARRELGRQAERAAARLEEVQRPGVLAALGGVLRLEDQRVLCFGTGCRAAAAAEPPSGLSRADLPLDRLRAGETVTGVRGSLVFAAAGATPLRGDALLVVVLTRRVETRLPGGLWFLAVAGLTLAVAAAVAADLARRLIRPLREAQAATQRMASGDLAVRVPVNREEGEELAELSESINAMAASLERSRGLERQFLLSVSHDLRTPLTSIRGYAEALSEGRAPDPSHAASVVLAEARRLERLVGDLLELARLDARRFSLDIRRTDVAEVVADTAEGFRPAAEKAGVELDVGAGTSPVLAAADPDRLAQVVANLVENALKYARARIGVGVDAGQADGQASLWVEDDGPGIEPADLPHVFEPFFSSTRSPTRQVGTGLGLAIVHELVEAMGGQVTAGPASGGGTRVSVSLPGWT
ncbi:MAG: HAMP domain-containing histidine kinase [Actinomycetota bacterium]|nr:HAMP domain-containing histidine kinase [Actinomycetota bacterium]